MVYCMIRCDLTPWVKGRAKPGDVAYWHDRISDKHYLYNYKGPGKDPYWKLVDDDVLKYIEEIDTLKIEGPKMEKTCGNCKHFAEMPKGYTWCNNEKHKGKFVSDFTSCSEHEVKEILTTPFDGIKFYLKDKDTGELDIKYVCEDCGKLMDNPYHWWLKVPYGKTTQKGTGYHFRCEACEKMKDNKV